MPVSLVIFIIAWVFIMVLSFGFPYNGTTHQGIVAVFSLFPWSLLSKGLLDLANATTGKDSASKGTCAPWTRLQSVKSQRASQTAAVQLSA